MFAGGMRGRRRGPKQSVLAFEAHLITTTTAHIQELINLQRQRVREYRTDIVLGGWWWTGWLTVVI